MIKSRIIYSDVLKWLYLGMLEELPYQQVKAFWVNYCPDFSNNFENPKQLFCSLWSESQWFDADIVFYVFKRLEVYLSEQDIVVEDFVGSIIQYFAKTNIVFARRFLTIAQDHLGIFYKDTDIYVELISLLPLFFDEMAPALSIKILDSKINNGAVETIIKCECCNNNTQLDENFGLWLSSLIKYMPITFGVPVFDRVALIADKKDKEEYLKKGNTDDLKEPFLGLLIKSNHQLIKNQKSSFLKNIIEHATSSNKDEWDSLKEKHNNIIRSIDNTTSISYHVKDASISVNGKHLVKSVPAQIFSKMMKTYMESGRTEFEYREFLRDKSIILDPLNPNLSIRIQRLQSLLSKKLDGVSIERRGQGKVALVLKEELHYIEEM